MVAIDSQTVSNPSARPVTDAITHLQTFLCAVSSRPNVCRQPLLSFCRPPHWNEISPSACDSFNLHACLGTVIFCSTFPLASFSRYALRFETFHVFDYKIDKSVFPNHILPASF